MMYKDLNRDERYAALLVHSSFNGSTEESAATMVLRG